MREYPTPWFMTSLRATSGRVQFRELLHRPYQVGVVAIDAQRTLDVSAGARRILLALAAFDFEDGTLILTEDSTKKRAAIHLVRGDEGLTECARGGIEPLEATPEVVAEAIERYEINADAPDPRLA